MNTLITANQIDLKLHHIAYATRDTDGSIEKFKKIYPNIEVYKIYEETQNVYFTYISSDFINHKIELVEPSSGPNPVENYLTDAESVLYHSCYSVNNFEKGYNFFRMQGYIPVLKPFRPSFQKGILVCHFYSKYTSLVEIIGEDVDSLSF